MKPDFVDFLASLAPPGETLLLVRQKPQLGSDKQLQYHGDGAVKATWPAFLPDTPRPEGQSWYCNTASFIIERFENGKPRAGREFAEYVLVMVLDDVGTKTKTPEILPTWVMETSRGSFQWGYAFEEQPTTGDYSVAIKAIADAGYTDPGAVNAVRNFRIPGSVNLKKGRENFQARLVEFHPERRFTLEQICTALGIVLGEETGVRPMKAVNVKDTGHDEVLQWLNRHDLVLSQVNGEGWRGVVCPNAAKHSDGNQEARYHSADRGFHCYHGSCANLKTAEFLEWVAENGGPRVAAGLREELLTSRLASSLKKLDASPQEDEAQAFIEKVERQERDRIDKAGWFARYAYVESDDCYFDLERRDVVSRVAFNTIYRHVKCRSSITAKLVPASIWYDENRNEMGGKVVKGLTYAAGDSAIVADDHSGKTYGNRWIDGRQARPARGDIGVWQEHCRLLVPDAAALAHVWDVMAYKLQNPKRKINHAVLHMGDEGCGKDTMWAPFIRAVCGPSLSNRALVNGDQISSQWGYVYESEILILNELREPDASQRRALANRLKPIIAAPPETISVNRKMLHPYDVANRLFVLAFSNEPLPVSIASQDRRWFVLRSEAPPMPEADAVRMWAWFREGGGYEAVAAWLYARNVSAFNPAARPPVTDAKQDIIEDGLGSAESWLVEQIRGRHGEFAAGVVGSPFNKLIDRLQGSAPGRSVIYADNLLHALKHAGWVDHGRIHSREYPNKKRIIAAPDMGAIGRTELRNMAEPAPLGGTVTPFSPRQAG